ncbi:MAG: FABP family protein [Bdellovibrionales bacterium]|nr:FABP family protein [Bdellovibrionales bacterium]
MQTPHSSSYPESNMGHTDEMTLLLNFVGVWSGEGCGVYPTIRPFIYDEVLAFELDHDQTALHYVQKALVRENRPSHMESGFMKVLPSGHIQLSNAQNGGRVEVLTGQIQEIKGGVSLELFSSVLDNDPRMVQTHRVYTIVDNQLSYEAGMSTTTTDTPQLQNHLRAQLRKMKGN